MIAARSAPTRGRQVTISEKDAVGPEVLATSIVDLSKAAKALLETRLTRKAILVLLQHSTGMTQKEIGRVLDAARDLGKDYVK